MRLSVQRLFWRDILHKNYDLALFTLGYETRSRFVAESWQATADRKVAFGFTNNKTISYDDNLVAFENSNFLVRELGDEEFSKLSREELLSNDLLERKELSVICDISSMSRLRIAATLQQILSISNTAPVTVDFVYSCPLYTPAPQEMGPIVRSGPVTPFFGGWAANPGIPSSVILGAGYEPDLALGAIEYIEPVRLWAFLPFGGEERFAQDVMRNNSQILSGLDKRQVLRYDIEKSYELFVLLESVVRGALQSTRPILVPLGPKMFCLSALLVALIHQPEVVVWRVSSDKFQPPTDQRPNGKIVCMRTTFSNLA